MGTVPNAVFERILIAVDANQSADVMTTANQLLDAGNSPAQLARQACRYLRNALIARIAGLQPNGDTPNPAAAELLQISPDEQRRAARTAALFTEEELTRFLQIMLKTFDELGYRQEQRFHFELGLLKLVHLRRLLPIEELLSAIPVAKSESPQIRLPQVSPLRIETSPAPAAPEKPAFSPFAQSAQRSRFDDPPARPAPQPAKPVSAPIDIYASAAAPSRPFPAEVKLPEPLPMPAPVFDPAPPAPDEAFSPAALQQAAIEALSSAKGQQSAADALEDATFTLDGATLIIQTDISKTMLPVVLNPEAERILRAAMPSGLKLTILPGTAAAAEKKPRPARTGSAQARATAHPVVQQAQSLFNAEIRTVIDLREGE
jgi:DNA polymerase-3 subunit gamma/tau